MASEHMASTATAHLTKKKKGGPRPLVRALCRVMRRGNNFVCLFRGDWHALQSSCRMFLMRFQAKQDKQAKLGNICQSGTQLNSDKDGRG